MSKRGKLNTKTKTNRIITNKPIEYDGEMERLLKAEHAFIITKRGIGKIRT